LRIAEVTVLPGNSLLHRGSFRDIGLAIGILDEFLWFRFPVRSLVRKEHFPDEIGENLIKDNE
jgi:hypothetical protein